MQIFSKISGQVVNKEPKVVFSKEQLEFDAFKASIFGLIDRTLSVRVTGPLYNNRTSESQIDGKEMFVEALLDLLSEKDNKVAIASLESLKYTNKEWRSINDKISEIEYANENIRFLSDNNASVTKIKDFLDKYALSDDFDDILEQQILKVADYQNAELRATTALKMLENNKYNKYPKNRLRSIANKYIFRANFLKKK